MLNHEAINQLCRSCHYYHGQSNGDCLLVCAVHPDGPVDGECPNWKAKYSIPIQARSRPQILLSNIPLYHPVMGNSLASADCAHITIRQSYRGVSLLGQITTLAWNWDDIRLKDGQNFSLYVSRASVREFVNGDLHGHESQLQLILPVVHWSRGDESYIAEIPEGMTRPFLLFEDYERLSGH